jgi:hypothetical protein
MAIAYVNSGALTGAASGTGTTPPLPASIVAGNLLIAAVYTYGTGGVHTWPAGWTQIDQQNWNSAYDVGSFAYRIATGTDSAPAVTWSSSCHSIGQVFQFSGTSATPISAARSFATGLTGTHTSASITTTANNSDVIYLDLSGFYSTLLTNPAGWTSDANAADGITGVISLGDKTVAASGSGSGAISTAGGAYAWVQWQQEVLVGTPTGTSSATLQNITGSGTGYSGNVSGATLQNITASGTGITGSSGTSAATLQNITASGTAGLSIPGAMAKTGQMPTKSMRGFWQTTKRGQMPIKSMTGVTGTVTTMNKTGQLPVKTMSSWPTGTMAKTARLGAKSMIGANGSIGSMVKTAQYGAMAKAGYFNILGTMAKTGFMPSKSMIAALSSSASYLTVSMHTEKQALVTFTNYPFNSFMQFNGKVYGASDAGLFELVGATDNGAPINATVTGGIFDGGDSHLKTIDRAYVGYRSTGDLTFTLTQHDDGQAYTYTLVGKNTPGIFGRRVNTGKGLRARYYQWSIANVNGAYFTLDNVELDLKISRRRIGGSDA